MHAKHGRHFFGPHPEPLTNSSTYEWFIPDFRRAAAQMPKDLMILNCTPGSALDCFPMVALEDAL
jgi:hypothetical protein